MMTQKVSVAPKQPAPLNRYDAKLIRFISIGVFGHAGPRRPPTRASPNRQCEIDQLREHCKNQRKQPASCVHPQVGLILRSAGVIAQTSDSRCHPTSFFGTCKTKLLAGNVRMDGRRTRSLLASARICA